EEAGERERERAAHSAKCKGLRSISRGRGALLLLLLGPGQVRAAGRCLKGGPEGSAGGFERSAGRQSGAGRAARPYERAPPPPRPRDKRIDFSPPCRLQAACPARLRSSRKEARRRAPRNRTPEGGGASRGRSR